MTDSIENNTSAIRDRLKAARAAQDPNETRRGGLLIRGRLYTWLATTRAEQEEQTEPAYQNIAAFWSMSEEPQLQPLLYQWVEEEGITVSLPVVTGPDQPLEFRVWTPDVSMQTGAFGIPEPQGPVAPPPDVVLVPTLGYTRKGDRIGYGKGYYDRTLAHLKQAGHNPYAMGIAWACGDLERMGVPHTPAEHDFPLNAILTDKGWALK
ncbi:MAG TPA: 5-formyltetrahydrofolate cyclo-ligase [Pusillimonas sp.]|jgi:5,10-methenyltetrahydrofolate synthetase|nr:5-formyltetrahydrofolate cyclo-ligase [Pusillimonas sp.]HBT34277.1 5-formyltetrahydrofolate cyclo-ligase [Pusillimonas sp.]HCN73858.1 5-formyltetrahydrofolate cyclo-ligase [Pusillimonas sp.]|tara:strand:- start:297111 stop:297734 length:624 start_codon:yes stop_codon:yes gene_type:complete